MPARVSTFTDPLAINYRNSFEGDEGGYLEGTESIWDTLNFQMLRPEETWVGLVGRIVKGPPCNTGPSCLQIQIRDPFWGAPIV